MSSKIHPVSPAFVDPVVSAAAWGAEPGRWPLPTVSDPWSRWHRAVALGGQGRYSLAVAELDAADRTATLSPVLRSLMASSRASWWRQAGAHSTAARYDGQAFSLVGAGVLGSSVTAAAACCDALTGLAADALGGGRFETADVLLRRSEVVSAQSDGSGALWRQDLRLQWVRAELAMMSGNGADALRYALGARERAAETDSLRHRIKTDLIVAAAHSAVGDAVTSRTEARVVLDASSENGLVPLEWAAGMLLAGLGEVTPAQSRVAESALRLRERGGVFAGA